MNKYLLTLPLPTDGINLLDSSLISDYEAAEGTKNVSFKDGVAHTRRGYIKDKPYNFPVVPGSIYNFMKDSVSNILVACGTTLKKQNADTYDDIVGALNTDRIECLPYQCALGIYDAPYNVHVRSMGSLAAATYSYKITSLTETGESVPSAAVTATLDNSGSVELSWTKVEGATGYRIYGRTSSGTKQLYTVDDPDILTFTDDGTITPNGKVPAGDSGITTPTGLTCTPVSGTLDAGAYSYKVSAITASGESIPSKAVNVTLSAVGGVTISWDELKGVSGYKIYGRTDGHESLITTINDSTTITFNDDGSITPTGSLPTENTTAESAYGDKCFILDGNKYRYFDGTMLLRDIPVYNPSEEEVGKYGTNVLITTPDEVNKQKFIVNDDERLWVAGFGKIVRVSHLQRSDYFPSTQVWKLQEDCTGMGRFRGEVMLFTENTGTLISGNTPDFSLAEHYVFTKLPAGYGCSQHRTIVQGNNAIYWANRSGVYRYKYLPTGYSIPECVSEFLAPNKGGAVNSGYHNKSIKKWIEGISDWSKVHAQFFNNEYRLFMGNKQVAVFDTINETWALYEYDKDFSCSMVRDDTLYYAQNYLYHMDYDYDPDGATYDGLSDDGVPIVQVLKSKFFDFGKAANKKKFKELYFTIYTPLISYDIALNLNLDNDYMQINNEIVNTVARMGELCFGDTMNNNETNLNYPVKIHHKGKKYNIQYELTLTDLNTAFTLLSVVLSLKVKELK
jgi:hypothetical protein